MLGDRTRSSGETEVQGTGERRNSTSVNPTPGQDFRNLAFGGSTGLSKAHTTEGDIVLLRSPGDVSPLVVRLHHEKSTSGSVFT